MSTATVAPVAPAEGSAVSTVSDSEIHFTVRDARNASGPLASVDSAAAIVRKGALRAAKVGQDAMWNGALLTHSVVSSGHVGTGKDATMNQGDYATLIGYSGGYITALKDLGRAAVVHGVKRGSKEWGFLCVTVDKQPRVKAAIRAESTEEYKRLIAPLLAEWTSTGKISKGAQTPRIASENEETAPAEENDAPNVTVTLTPAQTLDAALQTLDAALKALPVDDREAFAAAENRISAILAREITLRVVVESATA